MQALCGLQRFLLYSTVKLPKLVQYVLTHTEGENTNKICEQLYDLALLSHGTLSPERMTSFIARSNEIMMMLAEQ